MVIGDIQDVELDDGRWRRTARVRSRAHDRDLVVEAPAGVLGPVEDAAGLVSSLLLSAMSLGEDLEVDGQVAEPTLRGLDDVITVWRTWDPTLHEPTIRTAGTAPPAPDPGAERWAATCFSRGVDSMYSAVVRRDGDETAAQRLLFFDGIEPRHSPPTATAEVALAERAAEAVGTPLLVVRTNARGFHDGVRGWGDVHGSVLAGTATLLGGALRSCTIPSSYSVSSPVPWGSSPMVDRRFSTPTVRVAHDDVLFGRLGKVFALVRERPDLLPHLKVCYHEDRPDNCGRCSKCLHTMTALLAADGLHLATQLPDRVDLDALRSVRLVGVEKLVNFTEVIRALDTTGEQGRVREAMVHALRASVRPPARELAALVVDRLRGRRGRVLGSWAEPVAFDRRYTDEVLQLLTRGRPDRPLGSGPEHPRAGPPLRRPEGT